MIDIVPLVHQARQTNRLVLDVMIVGTRNGLSPAVVFVQIVQFHIQDGRLHFVQTAVASLVGRHVFLRKPVVGNAADDLCQFLIVGGHSTTITQGSEVLARIETMTSCIT